MTAAEAERQTGLPGSFFTAVADGCLLRANSDDLERTAGDLAGLRCPLVIHRPAALRRALHRHGRRLVRAAGREQRAPQPG